MAVALRLIGSALFSLYLFGATPAHADLKVCNDTDSRVGVALGYKDTKGWVSEGWWNIGPRSCETLLKGDLIARYYYVYAVDYDRGGSWAGKAIMCTRDKLFTIRGLESCEERGYQRTGFFEVDTTEEADWTVTLNAQTAPAPATNQGAAPPTDPAPQQPGAAQ
ncbi:DUF1036 domain-containing protein [Rhodoligotrophos ferricapiens]|uniref:DUF1036 domain-containing protein n=1 Tax=Rhodoligotrophos ferricapiens TaxID=3069264 RepID=UPI00315D2A8F